MSTELARVDTQTPAELIGRSSSVAAVCREIVVRTAQSIQGRKYVRVEGWQALATAHGCVASARDVERVEPPDGGYRAIGEVRRIEDGQVLCTAEGFVGDDEPMWAKRTVHARRAMAQTRAISRVCRSAFAHVVVMIDAGLSTTPAEEMTPDEDTVGSATSRNERRASQHTSGEKEPLSDRDQLLAQIKGLADTLKLKAPTRAALWQEHVGNVMDPLEASEDGLMALRDALAARCQEQA